MSKRPTKAEQRETDRVAGNAAFIRSRTDEELARFEEDYMVEGFEWQQLADERQRRGVTA